MEAQRSDVKQKQYTGEDLMNGTDMHLGPTVYAAYKESMKFEMVFWSTIFVVTIVLFVWQTSATVFGYIDQPLVTRTELVKPADGMRWPEVVACPVQIVHAGQRRRLGLNASYERDVLGYRPPSFAWGTDGLNGNMSYFADDGNSTSSGLEPPLDLRDYVMKAGYPKYPFLAETKVFGKHGMFDLRPDDWTEITLTERAESLGAYNSVTRKCFWLRLRGDSARDYRSDVAGAHMRLAFDLDTENAYAPDMVAESDGVRLWLGTRYAPGARPNVLLPANTVADVALRRERTVEANKPGWVQSITGEKARRCLEETEVDGRLKALNTAYTEESCTADCAIQYATCCRLERIMQSVDRSFELHRDTLRNASAYQRAYTEFGCEAVGTCPQAGIGILERGLSDMVAQMGQPEAVARQTFANIKEVVPRFLGQFFNNIDSAFHYAIIAKAMNNDTKGVPADSSLLEQSKGMYLSECYANCLQACTTDVVKVERVSTMPIGSAYADKSGGRAGPLPTIIECAPCYTMPVVISTWHHPDTRRLCDRCYEHASMSAGGDRVIVTVRYEHMFYASVTQASSMTFSTLLGTVGGHFSFWMGASLVSALKMCFYAVFICARRREKRRGGGDDTVRRVRPAQS